MRRPLGSREREERPRKNIYPPLRETYGEKFPLFTTISHKLSHFFRYVKTLFSVKAFSILDFPGNAAPCQTALHFSFPFRMMAARSREDQPPCDDIT